MSSAIVSYRSQKGLNDYLERAIVEAPLPADQRLQQIEVKLKFAPFHQEGGKQSCCSIIELSERLTFHKTTHSSILATSREVMSIVKSLLHEYQDKKLLEPLTKAHGRIVYSEIDLELSMTSSRSQAAVLEDSSPGMLALEDAILKSTTVVTLKHHFRLGR